MTKNIWMHITAQLGVDIRLDERDIPTSMCISVSQDDNEGQEWTRQEEMVCHL